MSYNEAKQAKNTVAGWAYTTRRAWEAACLYDGINPTERCIAFSEDNPYVVFYDKALAQLQETLRIAVPGGGYVGLILPTFGS